MNRTEPSGRGTANVRAPGTTDHDAVCAAALTPFVRLLARLVAVELAGDAGERWIDQRTSPLGRRSHRELAKRGAFPASKVGRFWKARLSDVERFIEAQGRAAPLDAPRSVNRLESRAANDRATEGDDDRDVRAALAEVGLELTPQASRGRGRKGAR